MAHSEHEWFHLTGEQPGEGEDAENKQLNGLLSRRHGLT